MISDYNLFYFKIIIHISLELFKKNSTDFDNIDSLQYEIHIPKKINVLRVWDLETSQKMKKAENNKK